MRSLTLGALALIAKTAFGYANTSPFFMWSTSQIDIPSESQLISANVVTNHFNRVLSQCPTEYYIITTQPNVTSNDFRSERNTFNLASYMSQKTGKSQVALNEVVGVPDVSSWLQTLFDRCSVNSINIDVHPDAPYQLGKAKAINVNFHTQKNSKDGLAVHDKWLAGLIERLPSKDYTVLYTTTSIAGWGKSSSSSQEYVDLQAYEMETPLGELFHTELKRDTGAHASVKNNQTMIDGPLFDKYQFFTPGIFMGFLVGFILLSILYVGLSALSSLQVTYAAFDKDMSPQAQKKAQ